MLANIATSQSRQTFRLQRSSGFGPRNMAVPEGLNA